MTPGLLIDLVFDIYDGDKGFEHIQQAPLSVRQD